MKQLTFILLPPKLSEYMQFVFMGYIKYCFFFVFLSFQSVVTASNNFSSQEAWKLAIALENVKQLSIEEKSYATLVDAAIRGIMGQLDEYSEYLDAAALVQLNNESTGQFVGIGVELKSHPNCLEIIACFDQTPASKAGLHTGDIITRIGNVALKNVDYSEAIALLRGRIQTSVDISVISKNAPLRSLSIKRQHLPLFYLDARTVASHIGYIRIQMFTEKTDQDVHNAIVGFAKNGPLQGLIIDIRSNPGGLLDSAVRCSDLFLDSRVLKRNGLIVSTRSRKNAMQLAAYATPGDIIPQVPIIVLTNEGTASAAEIMVSALKEHKRAVVMGRKTYGKGSVQSIIPLDKHSALKMTTAVYLSSKGQSIQGVGVEPHIVLDAPGYQVLPMGDMWIQQAIQALESKTYEKY